MSEPDLGLSHIALPVRDLDASIEFYRRFARLDVVHRREESSVIDAESGNPVGGRVAWMSDLLRPFAIVLLETDTGAGRGQLGGWAHLGVACVSVDDVDRRLVEAAQAGLTIIGPCADDEPVGYWGIIVDPDGHNLELSYGQRVGDAIRG